MTARSEEIDLTWRKSTYSAGDQSQCVEVAETSTTIYVRDSKTPDGPKLVVSAAPFSAFVAYARALEA